MLRTFLGNGIAGLCCFLLAWPVFSASDAPPPLVPEEAGSVVVLNIPQARIFLFQDGALWHSWPVGPGARKSPTPTGQWRIGEMRRNPTWYVPVSVQQEMAARGLPVKTTVPPGPNNPLGPLFVRLGQTTIGIHGTNRPDSISDWQSLGCVRMQDDDVLELGAQLKVGDLVKVVYEPLVIQEEGDEVYLSVFPDIYHRAQRQYSIERVQHLLDEKGIHLEVADSEAALTALSERSGEPILIGIRAEYIAID